MLIDRDAVLDIMDKELAKWEDRKETRIPNRNGRL
jgi:hypothetical protein